MGRSPNKLDRTIYSGLEPFAGSKTYYDIPALELADPAPPLHISVPAEARPEPRVRAMDVYGTGNEPWFFTTEADTGAFSVESVTGPGALATRGSRDFIARTVLERWLRLRQRGRWRS
ncbi:hypothetical protein EPUS_03787 [Endocarpon pusillum Z07020]|uniref:Uncharacterized protein n=1 Tax=Endocarpon pusillum (strain Z07020 / HMAS-L-300199) TaxID=1263415 RepID=U1HHX3_ENDPU|nr:uncharacterized protein EPUS_03787 [Endocarpon pusillum Z07020]ERF68469.1 hypothetical protein EPUS_03787 [Endocarpon pusillum Z07020]